MRHSLPEIYELMSAIPEPSGFPLRALMAGIAEAESRGNPLAWIPHDPPANLKAGPSSGLFQVHQPDWPEVYAATERVRLEAGLSEEEKIVRMTDLVRPIMADAVRAAVEASRVLASRGIHVGALEMALFVDATWQIGAPHLARWARTTHTGDARTIVNWARTVGLEVALRDVASDSLGIAPGIAVAGAVVGVFAILGLALSQWKT